MQYTDTLIHIRFNVLKAALLKMEDFWDVMLCHWASSS